jgi:hypothetical protein
VNSSTDALPNTNPVPRLNKSVQCGPTIFKACVTINVISLGILSSVEFILIYV